jgi:glycosyltransferase involved in cell wall biosynthesis
MPPDLSVVIPAFNEGRRIGPTLDKIRRFLGTEKKRGEIIVVNDGSTDATVDVVRDQSRGLGSGMTLQILENSSRRGKGYSVRRGMLKATGAEILYTDADLSSPIDEYWKLAAAIRTGNAAIAFGSRAVTGSVIDVHQLWVREMFGRASNLMVRKVSGLEFKDTQCGFKLFTRQAAHKVFSLQTIDGFAFDIEILYIAKILGITAFEVPVTWSHVPGTSVRFVTDAPRALADLLRIRYRDLRGAYDAQ